VIDGAGQSPTVVFKPGLTPDDAVDALDRRVEFGIVDCS
jgi:hypothetical protein